MPIGATGTAGVRASATPSRRWCLRDVPRRTTDVTRTIDQHETRPSVVGWHASRCRGRGGMRVGRSVRRGRPGGHPTGWQTEHLEVVFTPVDPVTITLAGGGPPAAGRLLLRRRPDLRRRRRQRHPDWDLPVLWRLDRGRRRHRRPEPAPHHGAVPVRRRVDHGPHQRVRADRAPLVGAVQGGPGAIRVPWGPSSSSGGGPAERNVATPVPARRGPGRTWCGRSSTSSCRKSVRRGSMGTPVPAGSPAG